VDGDSLKLMFGCHGLVFTAREALRHPWLCGDAGGAVRGSGHVVVAPLDRGDQCGPNGAKFVVWLVRGRSKIDVWLGHGLWFSFSPRARRSGTRGSVATLAARCVAVDMWLWCHWIEGINAVRMVLNL
jgi:hypothetical protein